MGIYERVQCIVVALLKARPLEAGEVVVEERGKGGINRSKQTRVVTYVTKRARDIRLDPDHDHDRARL